MNRRRFLTSLGLLPPAGLLACRRRASGEGTDSGATAGGTTPSPGSAAGTPTQYELIEAWAMHRVPKYPGSQPGELSPLPTQVEAGGTISFATPDSADAVLDFYRTALPALGWKLQPSPASSVSAVREGASLTVVVKGSEHGTTVLLMLADAP